MLDSSRASAPSPPARGDTDRAAPANVDRELDAAVAQATDHLLSLQREDGHWCAELEGDTILESEYAMLLLFFGRRHDPRFEQLAAYIRDQQNDEGGWSIFPGGESDISPTVKAYFVLKLVGDSPEDKHMRRAREVALRLGGLEACNSFTKLYLSIFGVWSWHDAPAVPPELILLPEWFYLNIYEMSSWSRAIVVPLAIVWALKPQRRVEVDLDELRTGRPVIQRGSNARERFWYVFFRLVNWGLHRAESLSLFRPVRARSLRLCEQWCIRRFEGSGGLAAIFPSIANAAMALVCRGYDEDHPLVRSQLEELEKLEILEQDRLRLQPCFSPVWDTALSMGALLDAGLEARHPALQRAATWLLDHEVRTPGDWRIKSQDTEPGGWYFEYSNEFYPDCDDTAEILAVLARTEMSDPLEQERLEQAIDRALRWQISMQSRDGGWAAFDKDCDHELFTYVPFADHNAMIDPPTADITSRTIEALVAHGRDSSDPIVGRALDFLEREQENDGSWYGRWGANYIYGTWLALGALSAAGRADTSSAQRGAEWFLERQNEDGGWGESLLSYADPAYHGSGESTAAQTAWALLGLMAVEDGASAELARRIDCALRRGVDRLLETQRPDGSWEDRQWTGTGFPQVFYLRYHYYDRYFPLQALATFARRGRPDSAQTFLREVSP